MARWSSGLRLRPLTPATRVRISYGSPLWATKEKKIVGVYSDEGPPVPIPNTAVKLISAENTWGAAPWEAVNRGVTGSSPVWGAKRKSTAYAVLFLFTLLNKGSNPWAAPYSKHAGGMFEGAGAAAAARCGFAKRKHVEPCLGRYGSTQGARSLHSLRAQILGGQPPGKWSTQLQGNECRGILRKLILSIN